MYRILTAAFVFAALPLSASADAHEMGNAEDGAKVFRKCMACHAVGADAKNKTGPVLNGVVGRAVGSTADFNYSKTLADMGGEGKTWTPEALDAFLTKPRDYAPGTKMTFAGLRKEDERKDVIAYLATFPGEGG